MHIDFLVTNPGGGPGALINELPEANGELLAEKAVRLSIVWSRRHVLTLGSAPELHGNRLLAIATILLSRYAHTIEGKGREVVSSVAKTVLLTPEVGKSP
jgi:hypothetical protein